MELALIFKQILPANTIRKTGLEIATDTGAFATKLFTFATKISRSVANQRPVCGQSVSHILAISNYLTSKLINEYHIEESCVLFVTENLNIYRPNPVKFTLNVRSTIGNFNLRKRLGHKTSLPPSPHSCLFQLKQTWRQVFVERGDCQRETLHREYCKTIRSFTGR